MQPAQEFEEAHESRVPYLEVVRRVQGRQQPRNRITGHAYDWSADAPYRHYDHYPLQNALRDFIVTYKTLGFRKVLVRLTISGVTGAVIRREIGGRYETCWRELSRG